MNNQDSNNLGGVESKAGLEIGQDKIPADDEVERHVDLDDDKLDLKDDEIAVTNQGIEHKHENVSSCDNLDVAKELEVKMYKLEIEPGHKKEEGVLNLEENGKLNVISRYLSMAVKGKESQALMLKDPEIYQFLILCLMDDSVPVVIAAMDVFEVIFGNRRNRATLQKLPYLKETLRRISKNSNLNMEVRQDGKNMLKILDDAKAPLGEQSNATRNSVNNSNQNHGAVKNQGQPEAVANNKLNASKLQTGLETILFLHNGVLQQKYVQLKVTAALIKVKGVISVTYNLHKNYCILRRKRHVTADAFAIAVANLGFQVDLVCKNNKNEVIYVPVSADRKDSSALKENLPEYLPEEDEQPSIGENAIKRNSDNTNKQKDGSWLDSTKNFLRSSFYW